MPDRDELVDFLQSGASTFDEFRSGGGRPTSREEPRGLIGRATDLYDSTLGYDWWPEERAQGNIKRARDIATEYGGELAGNIVGGVGQGVNAANRFLWGTPIDAAGSAATALTLGAAAPYVYGARGAGAVGKGVTLASKFPRTTKVAQNVARGVDLVQAPRAAVAAVEETGKGNYGRGALSAGGAALGLYGGLSNPYTPRAAPAANVPPPTDPAFMRGGRPAVRETFVPTPEQTDIIRKSYSGQTRPNVITDESRLLPGRDTMVAPPSERYASVVAPKQDALAERAVRDLVASGEEVSARSLDRYQNVDAYRSRVQAMAEKAGQPGGYERFVASGQVTPSRAGEIETPAMASRPVSRTGVPLVETVPSDLRSKVDRGDKLTSFEAEDAANLRMSPTVETVPSDLRSKVDRGDKLTPVELKDATELGMLPPSPEGTRLRPDQIETGAADEMVAEIPPGELVSPRGVQGETSRIDTSAEGPYRYGENPTIDKKFTSKVNRVLKQADKELADVTDPAERRVRLLEILGEKLTINELGAAFEGKILNSSIVRDATTNRISRGLEESVNVPKVVPQDLTENIGPPNMMPPPGFAGRPVEGPTANGPLYWNRNVEPPTLPEGIVEGPPTTPPQVTGMRQVQEAPVPRPVVRERTIDDIRQELIRRGMPAPSDEYIARIRRDPELLNKILPPETNLEGIAQPGRKLLTEGTLDFEASKLFENVDVAKGRTATAGRDLFGDNLWANAQKYANDAGAPDVANAIGTAGKYVDSKSMGLVDEARKSGGMSMETEWERMGPAGEQAILLKHQANADAVSRFDDYAKDVADEVDTLPKDRFEAVVDWLDGDKTVKLSPGELGTAQKMKEVLRRSGKDMDDRGMLEHGVIEEYWPRRWDGVPEKTIVQQMRDKGLSADQIAEKIGFIRKSREMKTGGEYSRSGNDIPGYRKDKDVFFDHLKAVSTRIELADRFGVKDTADPNSVISKLISQSSNPERARDIAERILRGGPEGTEGTRQFAHVARTYSTGALMQLSAISNMLGGALPVAVRGNIAEAGKSLFKIFNSDAPEMKFMKNVNRFNEFRAGLTEGMTTNKFNKWYGIDWTQNQVNKYAGSVGLGTAKSLFQELKANPTDKNTAWLLRDLVHEDAATLLKQTDLTDKQLKRAVTRMVDITQGVMHNEKLPYAWVRSGLGTIPQIFMRINFQVSKALKDGIVHAPKSSLAKLAVLGPALGEMIAAAKELPKTAGQVAMNEIQQATGQTDKDKDFIPTYVENMGWGNKGTDVSRFYNTKRWLGAINEDAAKNDALVHTVNALETSFAGGMPLNILAALAGTQSKEVREPGGSFLNDMFVAVDEGGQMLFREIPDLLNQGVVKPLSGQPSDFRDTARFVTRRLPIPGGVQGGVIREVDSAKQAAAGAKKKSKRSIYGRPEDFAY